MTVSLAGGIRHPKIYAWTDSDHDEIAWEGTREGTGLIKVGYTDRDNADTRIRESRGVKTPHSKPYTILLTEAAITNEGAAFKDHAVHAELERAGVRRVPADDGGKTEWFECTADEVKTAIDAVRLGIKLESLSVKAKFGPRPEQQRAVEQTAAYFAANSGNGPAHFLWNAKMRFGKTFATYQLAKELGWTRILVLTYKPAVETAWREDLEGHVDFDGWRFKGKDDASPDLNDPSPFVWFASFQDVLGTDDGGNTKKKNEALYETSWDAVVIDEYHFGAWRDAARSLYLADPDDKDLVGDKTEKAELDTPDLDDDFAVNLEAALQLDVGHYLYLSGTPFRALTQGEFLEDQVYNWTYGDEQRAKTTWDGGAPNPYLALPKMHLLAYQMPDKLRDVALNNMSEFSLTEFFRTERDLTDTPRFIHETEVQKWLDLLRGQDITGLWANLSGQNRPPLPYEDLNLLSALQHTIWYLPSVDACLAMRELLEAQHNTFFRDYDVIVAAGNEVGVGAKALPPVEDAIGSIPQDSKTVTLSCGKLMTGVTVPAWTGIFMLRELKSPESYFQAAFRVQSPWRSTMVDTVDGGETEIVHKDHCYVIDFAPNRALSQIADYATRLRTEVASERDDERAIEEFIEFLPVLMFEGFGMEAVSAADVIHFLTRGISSSMLARRWNSPELLTLDLRAMEALLANNELLESLERIEAFRNITNDLTAMITTNKELRQKELAKDKLSKVEKDRKKDAAERRAGLREKLQHFVTRIPVFMYLTDDREKAIRDIIRQVEPELFEQVTSLTLDHFEQLVNAGVFNDSKMNDAVWKFRTFEEPSLHYDEHGPESHTVGGWSLSRDERFAQLVNAEILNAGDELSGEDGALGVVTDDYGIAINGVRYESPDAAAAATGASSDGWSYWRAATSYGDGTLVDLAGLCNEQTEVEAQ